jgi:hypothetical protein
VSGVPSLFVYPVTPIDGNFRVPYADDGGQWGQDECYTAFIEWNPQLSDDQTFQDRFDDLFASDMNFNDARDAHDRLADYLDREYGIDIDDYFNWQDWRVEHQNS